MNYKNNTLEIRSLFTTLDIKNIVTSYNEFKDNSELKTTLLSCICSTTDLAKLTLSNQLRDKLNSEEFKNSQVLQEISNRLINYTTGVFYENSFGDELTKFLEADSIINKTTLEYLNSYTKGLTKMSEVNLFTPVLNECLIDPLRIIFNFGTLTEIKNAYNQFDLDIKVRILDETEKYNAVGWKCGYLNTSYLSWITADNTTGRTRSCNCRYR